MENFVVNTGLIIAYILIAVGVLLAIVFPIINAISEPKTLVKSAIGLLGILIIYGIGYAISDGELNRKFIDSGVTTETLSRMIGGALKMVYLLMFIAAAGIVYTEFNKTFIK